MVDWLSTARQANWVVRTAFRGKRGLVGNGAPERAVGVAPGSSGFVILLVFVVFCVRLCVCVTAPGMGASALCAHARCCRGPLKGAKNDIPATAHNPITITTPPFSTFTCCNTMRANRCRWSELLSVYMGRSLK